MKKIVLSLAVLCMAMGGRAETEMAADDVCQGWPEEYDGVMLQAFWWDSYDATKWTNLTARVDELSQYFDLIWIPNAGTTSTGKWAADHGQPIPNTMGYDPCYWLEYNTCFGTEAELKEMIAAYKAKNVGIIEDVVLNHKNGVSGWCDFPQESVTGSNGTTYTLTWDNTGYAQICKNDECNGHGYATSGADDTGDNFDGYRDLDHTNSQTQENCKTYCRYLIDEMGFAGFRYDMVKGYGAGYVQQYNQASKPEFSVGEYWDNQTAIQNWIMGTGNTSAAFDFPLKSKLNQAVSNGDYSALSWKSFAFDPQFSRYAITFADNHDTGREDYSKLANNWSAANAFLLASPGTPCIWLTHYNADPTNIGAMIKARKAAGITNTTCLVAEQWSTDNNRGYWMRSDGTSGSVIVLLGEAATSQVGNVPSDYSLVAQGDAYKFYASLNEPNVTVTPNGGVFYDEEGVEVTLTPNGPAKECSPAPWYRINDGDIVPLTDATTITVGAGLADGETVKIWWYLYDNITSHKAYEGTVTFTKKVRTDEVIYLNNAAGWNDIYCYAWNEEGGAVNEALGAWPGTKAAYDNSVGSYTMTIPATAELPTKVIWNSGAEADQTKDLAYEAGKTYTNVDVPEVIYFKNTAGWETVYCYAYANSGAKPLGAWPGKVASRNADGDYYVSFTAAVPDMVIWNNGNGGEGNQTADLEYENGRTYDASGNAYWTVYFANTVGWPDVYFWAWSDSKENESAAWPGRKLTEKDYETSTGGYYKAVVNSKYSNIIFNNGNGAQTGDLKAADGHIYWSDSSESGSAEYVVNGGNGLFYPSSIKVGGPNVVKNNGGVYTCENLVLTDKQTFVNTVDFTASTASYSREMGSYKWGTVCLPFALESNDEVQYYTLKSVTDETMSFGKVSSVAAGQPAVFKLLTDAGTYSVEMNDVEVKATGSGTSTEPIEDWTMKGTYERVTDLRSGDGTYVYFIGNDAFWEAENAIAVNPFRGWFETKNQMSQARIRIMVDDETEGIETVEQDRGAEAEAELYDLMGRRITEHRAGLAIERGRVVFKR